MDRCNSRLAGISAHLSCPRGSFAAGHTLGGVRATPSAATLPPVFEAAPGLHGLSATERYYFETQGFVVIPAIIPRQLLAKLNTVREIFSSQARAPSNPSALEEGCGLTDCLGRGRRCCTSNDRQPYAQVESVDLEKVCCGMCTAVSPSARCRCGSV